MADHPYRPRRNSVIKGNRSPNRGRRSVGFGVNQINNIDNLPKKWKHVFNDIYGESLGERRLKQVYREIDRDVEYRRLVRELEEENALERDRFARDLSLAVRKQGELEMQQRLQKEQQRQEITKQDQDRLRNLFVPNTNLDSLFSQPEEDWFQLPEQPIPKPNVPSKISTQVLQILPAIQLSQPVAPVSRPMEYQPVSRPMDTETRPVVYQPPQNPVPRVKTCQVILQSGSNKGKACGRPCPCRYHKNANCV